MTNKIKIILVSSLAIAILAILVIWQFIGGSGFDLNKVKLVLVAPQTVTTGEDFVVRILYENNNKLSLNNVVLVFDKPNEFTFVKGGIGEYIKSKEVSLGVINPGGIGELKLKGSLIAPMDSTINFKFHLKFIPGNVNAALEKIAEAGIRVSNTPITVSLEVPSSPINGYPVEYKVNFANATSTDFQKVAIFADYPGNFNFVSSNIQPILGDNKVWNIEILKGLEKRELIIKGVVSGNKDEVINMKISIGIMSNKGFVKYAEAAGASILILPPISLTEIVNGSIFYNANPGEELDVVIKYKNDSPNTFKALRITSNLSGEVLDFTTLRVDNGIYDEIANPLSAEEASMSWSDRTLPSLSALGTAEEREVRFKIRVKDKVSVRDTNSKNFVVKNLVKVYAKSNDSNEEKMIIDNEFITKLSSKLILNTKAYYNDDGRIMNSGPIPPTVGRETYFTIHWQVLNMTNDVRDVVVRAPLPQGVIWNAKIIPKDSPVRIESKDGRYDVVWKVGNLPANAGIFSPVQEVVFQIGIKPESRDVGDYKILIGKTDMTGIDNFTGISLITTRDEVTTRLYDDISIGPEEGKVVQ